MGGGGYEQEGCRVSKTDSADSSKRYKNYFVNPLT